MEGQPQRKPVNSNWIWGAALIILGALFLLNQVIPGLGGMIWATVTAGIGLAFFAVYLSNRQNWWALIPAYVFWAVTGLLVMITIGFAGAWIPTYVLLAIAAPFYYVYGHDTRNWWALIPAYTLTAIGAMVFLIEAHVLVDLLIPAYVMFAIAVPFGYVYAHDRRNWWALIPGGIMAALGIAFMVAGFAYLIPVVLIAAGIFVLVRQMGSRAQQPLGEPPAAAPKTGPQADHPVVEFTPLGNKESEPTGEKR